MLEAKRRINENALMWLQLFESLVPANANTCPQPDLKLSDSMEGTPSLAQCWDSGDEPDGMEEAEFIGENKTAMVTFPL